MAIHWCPVSRLSDVLYLVRFGGKVHLPHHIRVMKPRHGWANRVNLLPVLAELLN